MHHCLCLALLSAVAAAAEAAPFLAGAGSSFDCEPGYCNGHSEGEENGGCLPMRREVTVLLLVLVAVVPMMHGGGAQSFFQQASAYNGVRTRDEKDIKREG